MTELNITSTGKTESLEEQVARLTAENQELKTKRQKRESGKLSFKVSEKGCVSVYGIRQMGIHFYLTEWLRLFNNMADIVKFANENQSDLSHKSAEALEKQLAEFNRIFVKK